MENIIVKTTKTIEGETYKVETNLFVGDSLQDLIDKYGDEFVHELAIRSLKVAQQQQVRADIESAVAEGKDVAEIAANYENWDAKANQRTRKTPAQKLQEMMAKLDPAELESLKSILLNS